MGVASPFTPRASNAAAAAAAAAATSVGSHCDEPRRAQRWWPDERGSRRRHPSAARSAINSERRCLAAWLGAVVTAQAQRQLWRCHRLERRVERLEESVVPTA